ncbi:MAG: hypothetical protein V4438_02025 [Patescibacteria group bacterium]
MDILETLFGNAIRARLLRAFVYNPDDVFAPKSLAKKVRASSGALSKEIKILKKINLVKDRTVSDEKGRKIKGVALNQNFKFVIPFREFLMNVSPLTEDAIAKKLGDKGKAKLVVISGMFLDNNDSRADMLVVSEKQNDKIIQKTIADISTEFGRDISYALFTKDDFSYRMNMGDKLIRDIFDFPHKIILDKIGVGK